MLGSNLERFIHSFTDSDRWYHDDKLAPSILLVEFEHRLGIDIGFSSTCLHLDREVLASLELLRNWESSFLLDILYISQECFFADLERFIREHMLDLFSLEESSLIDYTSICDILTESLGLPDETIYHRIGSICLISLLFEFELHNILFL